MPPLAVRKGMPLHRTGAIDGIDDGRPRVGIVSKEQSEDSRSSTHAPFAGSVAVPFPLFCVHRVYGEKDGRGERVRGRCLLLSMSQKS